ncbi:MAG TPA: L,D-transpeptidase [Actinomycetota bacterium]
MRNHPRGTALQASWLATALAAMLAVVGPLTARAVGERAAVRPAQPVPTAVAPAVAATVTPVADVAAVRATRSARTVAAEADRAQEPAPEPYLLVHARDGLVAHAFPNADARSLGEVAAVSKYYRVPLVLWVERTTADGRWGRVELPYVFPRRDGWIRLQGLRTDTTWVRVDVDLSRHTVRVYKRDELLYRVAGATGAPASPTPSGEYVVTDRVPFPAGHYLGTFAFGISGIQPRLPAGWTGGDQLAIHGTNSPSTIGQSVSAGCVRVSESSLDRFKPLLRLGTPVVIHD